MIFVSSVSLKNPFVLLRHFREKRDIVAISMCDQERLGTCCLHFQIRFFTLTILISQEPMQAGKSLIRLHRHAAISVFSAFAVSIISVTLISGTPQPGKNCLGNDFLSVQGEIRESCDWSEKF